jgi:hypothetical protein
MAAGSSMQYTIGTALDRARSHGLEVEVLVEGQWLTGSVAASDGVGVVLDREGVEHFVVRLDRIAAVRVGSKAPMLESVETERSTGAGPHRTADGAVPMPAPAVPRPRSESQPHVMSA